jgi:NADPH:quinone reductase-like Zn-dependent oxidoreductase
MKHSEAEQSAVQAGAIPQTMRAAAVERFGGPQALCIHELAVPRPGANEVLIALDTAGVGGWDASFRDGSSKSETKRMPLVLGTDGAGTVVAAGARMRRLKPGDQVYAYSYDNPKGGFYAEYVAVAATKVAPVPAGLDLVHAGAIPTIALTALQGVDDALEVKRGETLIVHGASGNVGMLALQFAKRRGAYVIATASGADGAAFVRRLGADVVIDGKRQDIGSATRAPAPHGIDAVLAFVGGKALTRALDLLRKGGRVAHPNGIEPAPKKRRGLKFTAYDGEPGVREFERLAVAIEQAKLQIPIAESFELSEAARAHARLGKGHVLGKIVLRIRAA